MRAEQKQIKKIKICNVLSSLLYCFLMQFLVSFLPYVQIALSVLLIGGIVLQQRGAGMGGAFGGGESFGYNTRRGAEKIFFEVSIGIAILLVLSAILTLIIK